MGRIVIQRVKRASVSVDGQRVSAINTGIVVLVGLGHQDTDADLDFLVRKLLGLRLWDNAEDERWRKNVQDIDGAAPLLMRVVVLL